MNKRISSIICKECGIDLRDYNDKNVKCKPKPSSIIKNGTIIPSHCFVKQTSTKRQRKMIYFSILGKSIMIMWRKYYLVSRQQMITAHLYTKDKYLQTIKELFN